MIIVVSIGHASTSLISGSTHNWIACLDVIDSRLATVGDRGKLCRIGLHRDHQHQSDNHRRGNRTESDHSIGFRARQRISMLNDASQLMGVYQDFDQTGLEIVYESSGE